MSSRKLHGESMLTEAGRAEWGMRSARASALATSPYKKDFPLLWHNPDLAFLDSAATALSSMKEILELVENDLTAFDIAALATQYLVVKDYEIVLDRIPYDGMYTIEHENLVPEQPATNDRLLAALYGE